MKFFFYILWIALFILLSSLSSHYDTQELKINQIQIIGSHNSYRLKSYAPLFKYWSSFKHPILKIAMAKSLDYSNDESFAEQFSEYGIRQLEIDIYHDPQGGLFYNRKGNKLINEPVASGIEALKKPGLKVMHVPDFDYMTQHFTFIDALTAVKIWSDTHPNHLPIYIMIDAKESNKIKLVKKKYCTPVLKFTKNAVDSIDLEIESVFGKNSKQLITPDKIRGDYKTLNEAVLKNAWPALSEARGKICFVLLASSQAKAAYLDEHPSLQNRLMFMYSSPGKAEAAFLNMDDPEKNFKLIQDLVKQGYMIRTRSDAQTNEARSADYSRFNKAQESGAQLISTDYYKADERYLTSKKWTNFQIQFPDKKVARVNHVNTAASSEKVSYLVN